MFSQACRRGGAGGLTFKPGGGVGWGAEGPVQARDHPPPFPNQAQTGWITGSHMRRM